MIDSGFENLLKRFGLSKEYYNSEKYRGYDPELLDRHLILRNYGIGRFVFVSRIVGEVDKDGSAIRIFKAKYKEKFEGFAREYKKIYDIEISLIESW